MFSCDAELALQWQQQVDKGEYKKNLDNRKDGYAACDTAR